MRKIVFIIIFILGPASIIYSQSKYDNMISEAEEEFEKGDYNKAVYILEDFKKSAFAKLGQKNQYTHTYHLLRAKYKLYSGHIQDFEISLRSAVIASASFNKELSLAHGLLLLDATELYIYNGSYKFAKLFLNDAQKILESGFMTATIQARLDLNLAEILMAQGFYLKAIDLLKKREPFFSGRAVKLDVTVDDKGNIKSKKLTEEEISNRYKDYARMLTLMGNTYGRQGNLKSADSVFSAAARWIIKNIGRNSLAYIHNQFYTANMLVENGNEHLPHDLDYRHLLELLKIEHKETHALVFDIYEALIKQLHRFGNDAAYNFTRQEYETMINKHHLVGSIYHVRLKSVEFDAKLDKNKTKTLELEANGLITGSAELPRDNHLTTQVLDFLYGLSIYKRNFKNAEKYLLEIIDIKGNLFGAEAPETHLAKVHLANFYLNYTNKVPEANTIYENSFRKIVEKEIGSQHKELLEILNHLATIYELTDRYTEAAQALDQAVYLARTKYDDKDYQYAAELTNIAQLQIRLGEYEKADVNLKTALTILEEFKKDNDKKVYLINAIETQATLFGIMGLFDEAQASIDRSSKIISKAERGLVIDELNSILELAELYIQLGRYSATEELLVKLISEYEKIYGTKSIRLISPLVDKATLALAKGDYSEATKIAERAKQIALTIYEEKSTKMAPILRLFSDIEYSIGDYDNAEINITKALQAQEKQFGRNHIDVAKSLGHLGLIKFYNGDPLVEVEKIMTEAKDIIGSRLGKENPQYADILKNVAILKIAGKQYDEAFASLKQAEAIWKTKTGSKQNINEASIYTLTGDVYYQLKNYKKAEELYIQAKGIYERYFSKSHPEYVRILSKQAKVYYMEKDYKRSKLNIEEALSNYENFIKQYFPTLTEREKAKYWNTIKGDFEFYNTLAFGQLEDFKDLSGKVYNYQLLTKALLLSSSIKVRERILASNDEALKTNYNLWIQKKESLTNALSMSAEQLTENEIDPISLTNEVEKLERELSIKSELFGQGVEAKKITYEDVQKSINIDEVAVELVRYRYFNHTLTDSIIYVALYVKNDNAKPKVITLHEGSSMENRYFKFFRNSIINEADDRVSYKIFWEPIERQIGKNSRIYFSPDGIYNLINLESIATPDGKYVIDNSNIVIVSNTKDLYSRKLKRAAASTNNNATMFGNPNFYVTTSTDQTILPLPGTAKEVVEIEKLLNESGWTTKEYVEAAASEERVKELESPKIFHIATHGFSPPPLSEKTAEDIIDSEAAMIENPLLKTGLLLKGAGDLLKKTNYNYNIENGILTAYEAMNLNLDQTDLVVLSACETGLGEIANGEGVYGLQRAFLVAGAKVLIMSMFKVDDEATQKLILNFYRKWLSSGNMRQSFTEAKKELRVEYPDPIFWGSFMMIGLDQ